jgi:hypothetical protein
MCWATTASGVCDNTGLQRVSTHPLHLMPQAVGDFVEPAWLIQYLEGCCVTPAWTLYLVDVLGCCVE